jgi:NADH dehydrogenase
VAAQVDRIVVTGANGSLGRRLLVSLAAGGGPAARALVRSERAAATVRALPLPAPPDVRIVDYHDADAVGSAAGGCAAAVHLVGILKETPNTRYADAHEATCSVLARIGKPAGLRHLVYLSVLGADPSASNACLASKGRAERILLESGVATTVLRVPMVLGGDGPASNALRARARARVVPLLRGGASLEQPIDADDVVRAILAALERGESAAGVLELAGPESLPHRELLRRAAALVGGRPRIVPIPLVLARLAAGAAERLLEDPPVTRAMLDVLDHDDRIDPSPACRRLRLALTPLDQTLRRCLAATEPGR